VVRPGEARPRPLRAPPPAVLARASLSYNLARAALSALFPRRGGTMAVGKNKRLTKGGKKGAKKKV